MAWVHPNTDIYLLSNVPLEPTYENTLWFANADAQYNYFYGQREYTILRATYQRVSDGVLYIPGLADDYYGCNYLMFKNRRQRNGSTIYTHWFYGFITDVEYINENTTKIVYEIDVMQTWHFDYTTEQCFVEREHSANDLLYENIVDENLELGDEYVCISHTTFDMNEQSVCILINRVLAGEGGATTQSQIINNIYIPMRNWQVPIESGVSSIDYVLDQYQEGDIVSVYQFPLWIQENQTPSTWGSATTDFNVEPADTTLRGYRPRNKKLFTYPYNFLLVSNNCGLVATYKWEDWSMDSAMGVDNRGKFTIEGVSMTTPSVFVYPRNYRHLSKAYDDGLIYDNFPVCAWSGDVFKAWWAENKNTFITQAAGGAVSSASSGALSGFLSATMATGNVYAGLAGGVVSGLANAATSIAGSVAKVKDIKNTPSQTYGQIKTESLNAGIGRIQFDFYCMSIKPEYAKIIDDYFDMYGYATHRVKYPHTHVRQRYTYTKTIGCEIKPALRSGASVYHGVPASDAKKICSIYDKGIRFWVNPSEVGSYTAPNPPL